MSAGDSKQRVVVGLGLTGVSCARHLAARGLSFSVMDSRVEPPGLAVFVAEFPSVDCHLGSLDEALLAAADELYVSPGIALDEPALQAAVANGAQLCSELDLFAAEANAPVIAITGSNAKSTVTTLVGDMARCAGMDAGVGGNLGTPMLELLDAGRDCYVLELSSFQLERCRDFSAVVTCILNISADHIDRHGSMDAYSDAKQVIYREAQHCIVNRHDAMTYPRLSSAKLTSFGLDEAASGDWGIVHNDEQRFIARGGDAVLPVAALKVVGSHNILNVIAAFAIGDKAGFPLDAMCEAASTFSGLPHRCELVAESEGVVFINDSKATNTGATIAALQGLRPELQGDITLIAGGQGKGADFSVLRDVVAATAARVLLYGEDAEAIGNALQGVVPVFFCADLAAAFGDAVARSAPGDAVLFSPACASFDMFDNFVQRGDAFRTLVFDLLRSRADGAGDGSAEGEGGEL